MNTIFSDKSIKIYDTNTLILGATISRKNAIKKELSSIGLLVDNNYKYKAKNVKEVLSETSLNKEYFKLINNKEIKELLFNEYYMLAIMVELSKKPKYLLVDSLFGFLTNKEKSNVISSAKANKTTLIVFDNELYPVFEDFEVIIVHNDSTAIYGDFKDVVLEEKILKRLGYCLPFYVDLSIQLKLFGMIDKICYDKNELEEALWK